MKERSTAISPVQLMLLAFGTVVGVGFITLPRGVVEKAREDAWITVLLAGALALIVLWLIARAARMFPNDTVIDYNKKVFGRTLGFLANMLITGYFILFTVTGVRTMAEVVRSEMLSFTPVGVIIFAMLVTILYSSWDGLMPILRILESGLPITFVLIIFFFLFAYLEADWYELKIPFTEGIKPVLQPIPKTIYSYLGIEVLLLFYPFVVHKQKAFQHAASGIVLAAGFYTFIVLGALVTLGPDVTITQVYPVITMTKVIEVVRQFVERAELLFIILWLPLAFTTHLVTFFSAAFSLHRTIPWISPRLCMGVLMPLVFLLSLVPGNLVEMDKWSDFLGKMGIFILIGYPLILFVAVFLRQRWGHLPRSTQGR